MSEGHKVYNLIDKMVMIQPLRQKVSCKEICIPKSSKYTIKIKISQNNKIVKM